MHHRLSCLVLTLLLVLPAAVVFAQEAPAGTPAGGEAMTAPQPPEGMPAGGPMGGRGKRRGMHAMMGGMGHMGGKNMVATSDGGVVIMAGNKVIKYDKDLNLVKEVEFKGLSPAPASRQAQPPAGGSEADGQEPRP